MLLLGAGAGEATCGILYLASYLRRGGVEAYVRLHDADETPEELTRSLGELVSHLRPRLVGISLKWFHHVARARQIARTLKELDPEVQIVLGGNTATYWWKELLGWQCVDHVVLGDGELPLLELCRGTQSPPNVVSRGRAGAPLGYVQGASTEDVYYSHLDEVFLSQVDRHSFSGWVAPGKGCAENCLYCGGTRGVQKATFGRATPFLRPVEAVQRDHREIVPWTWQLRYDFAGSTPELLEQAWDGVDLSGHATTYFLWGVPPPALTRTLARRFERVFMVLDIGCFSELQRQEQLKRGVLKPCPTDAELDRVIEDCRRYPNLELEISGIAGLPFASEFTLAQERRLVERLVGLGCTVGYQRLEAQPGALVTEHPARFGMVTEAGTFTEFLDYFARQPPGERGVPMVRYADRKLEAAVQRTADELQALIWDQAARRRQLALDGATRLKNAAVWTRQLALGDWLGRHRVPARVAREPVTVVRSVDGSGVSCAPTVSPRRFADPSLQQGDDGAAILAVLDAFQRPTTVNAALARLRGCDPDTARELIDHLAQARFLERA